MDGRAAFRYLALGDSYTIGTSVHADERWPKLLIDRLDGDGRIEYVAKRGWTTQDLIEGIETADPTGPYALVSLLIGVNDQYDGLGLPAFTRCFGKLLSQAVEYAGGDKQRVFAVSIPDYAYTPQGRGLKRTSEEIARFNEVASRIALRNGVAYLNVTPISQRGLTDPDLVAADGLHPSAKQYRLWTEKVLYPHVVKYL